MNTSGLRPYQISHVENLCRILRTNGSAFDASDTGTGKTFAACAVARELGVVPLVLCPLSVVHSWRAAANYFGVDLQVLNYERARGATRKVNQFAPGIYGPSFRKQTGSELGQAVPMGRGSRWVWKYEFELAIFDEVQRCGGETSLLSKMLIGARRQFKHLLCLSATAASKPSQLKALGFALRLFELKQFRWWLLKRGCVPGIFGGIVFSEDPDKQRRAMEKIHHEIFPSRGARLRKRDIPGFPETQIEVRLIDDVSGKAGRLAEDVRDAYLSHAETGEGHLLKHTRAHQALELLMTEVVAEMAEDYAETSRIVVFVNYTATIDVLVKRLAKIFGAHAVNWIDGRNPGQRAAIERDFQNDNLTALVVNSRAGGSGMGFHGRADRTALILPQYSADVARQVTGRVNRDGGSFSQQFFLYFKGTVQEQTALRLQTKLNNLDTLNDAELSGAF